MKPTYNTPTESGHYWMCRDAAGASGSDIGIVRLWGNVLMANELWVDYPGYPQMSLTDFCRGWNVQWMGPLESPF